MSVPELIEELEAGRYSARTKQAYIGWLTQLRTYCGADLRTARSESILGFIKMQKRRGLKDSSVRQAIAAIKFYFRTVTPRPDVVSLLPTVRQSRQKTYIPDRHEIDAIVQNVQPKTLQTFYYLIYGAGLELGEAVSLLAKAVNPKTNVLTFTTQRRKLRRTPIPKIIAPAIAEILLTRKPRDLLFQKKGRAISKSTAQRTWAKARQSANADPRTNIRSLRHAYVRHLTQNGYSLKEVLHHLQLNSTTALDYYAKYDGMRAVDISPLDVVPAVIRSETSIFPYVSRERIVELSSLTSSPFDLSRVVSILRELNHSAQSGNLHSIPLLLRMLIDHTVPIFGMNSFREVTNNTSLPRSLKKNFVLLDSNLRNVADLFLHDHIAPNVSLPTEIQVDFRQPLDQYLGQVVVELRGAST